MAVTVDWAASVISVPKTDMTQTQTTPYEIRELNLIDFWQSLRDLEDSPNGRAFQRILDSNPPSTFGGVTLARTVAILEPYTITFDDAGGTDQYAVQLTGANSNVADRTNLNLVQVRSANSAGLLNENLEDVQFLSYWNDSVWVDVTTSNVGTTHPVGTTRAPVNNFADAQSIADARGLYNITIRNNSTISSSTHDSIKFYGRSPRTSVLTVQAGATLTACEFEAMLLTGDLGSNGSSYYTQVALKDVSGIFGHLEGCVLREGTNTLSTPNGFVMLNKCAAVSAVDPGIDIPILDLNGSGRVAARSLDGEIKITNKSSGNNCSLHLDGAVIELDSTITSGHWRFHGVGAVIDNSTGSTTVDVTDLVAPEYIGTAAKQNTIFSLAALAATK